MARPAPHDYIDLLPNRREFFRMHRHIFWRHEPAMTRPAYEHLRDDERWLRNVRLWAYARYYLVMHADAPVRFALVMAVGAAVLGFIGGSQ